MSWSAQQISRSRREFLSLAARLGAATVVFGTSPLRGATAHMNPNPKKIIVVTFGFGARDDETVLPGGQENILHLPTTSLADGRPIAEAV